MEFCNPSCRYVTVTIRGESFPEHTLSRFVNHKTLGQLTNQSTFYISEGGASLTQELSRDRLERGAAKYVKIIKHQDLFSYTPKTKSKLRKRA